MNEIFNRSKTKRRYKRKPPCLNRLGLCEHNKCRCYMAVKAPKLTSKGIKVDHKREQKVVDRLREKAKQANDLENGGVIWGQPTDGWNLDDSPILPGEYYKNRYIRKRYERMVWLVLGLVCLVALIIK